ncbi:hypothetical protein GZH47_19950 [Paenibacillus rhizovicinus]|uniref:Uncharacterized protein n=1 Tax=Paenibacillus rhizovicinus TaxID=2704463 RepID=A0A6C0P310_9BACL|nr:hypothetical protein [Paenibacillus rhizovicinus]QHW32859.1 hypothetical protein GZH47_19950 [Paenibacillus rhizovicinus]
MTDRPNSFNASGYIFIGFSKGITYYVSVNYDMAAAIMKLHRATIEGYVYFLFPEGLKAEVANQGYGRRPAINTKSFRYLLAN